MSSKKTNLILSDNIAGVNQILPHTNMWSWKLFVKGCANNWMPTEVSMQQDVSQWKSRDVLTVDERLVVKRCLGFFAGSESLVANNLLLNAFKYVTDPECRQYILRQAYEECYAEGTEVLTPRGWVAIEKLDGEKVLQVYEDSTSEFIHYSGLVEYEKTEEPMYRFRDGNGYVDLLVTAGHRMVYASDDGKLAVQEASTISYAHKRMIVAATNRRGDLYDLSPLDRFRIAFQADGSFAGGDATRDGSRNGGFQTVSFTFVKDRKKVRLECLCERLGYRYSKSEDEEGRARYYVWVPNQIVLHKGFDWVDLEAASSRWCQLFINELAEWDGWKKDRYTITGYDTTNEPCADIAQAVAVLAGYKCNRGLAEDDRKDTYLDLHRLSFSPSKNWVSRGVVKKTVETYTGKVRCLSVPSGMLVVRYNGKVAVSGNSLHNMTIVYVCDSLDLSIDEVYEAYNTIPSIKAKDDFLMGITTDIGRADFTTKTVEGKREFLRNLLTYYIVCEGIFFFSGFAMLLSFGRQNKLPGISEQIQYTLRDESLHIEFGTTLINVIREQNPDVWTPEFEAETVEHIKSAVKLEVEYAKDVLPNGILGLNASMFLDYMEYIANRRLEALHVAGFRFPSKSNPFGWMSEIIDLEKNKNFFETRVTNYKMGQAKDDF